MVSAFSNIMRLMIGLKKERRHFDKRTNDIVISKQKRKCKGCGKQMNKYDIEYDHKDGNSSNNKISNCQALHTSCHRKKHVLLLKQQKHRSIWKHIFN